MTKNKIKNLLDFLPFVILIVSAAILLWTVITADTTLIWKHLLGLIFLPIIFLAFRRQHKIGVLVLGATLLIGLVGFLSYSSDITIVTGGIGSSDTQIPVFYGQPIFLLWITIHLVVSGRYYFGIATKKYWQELLSNS